MGVSYIHYKIGAGHGIILSKHAKQYLFIHQKYINNQEM